jgi:hypothetical protein
VLCHALHRERDAPEIGFIVRPLVSRIPPPVVEKLKIATSGQFEVGRVEIVDFDRFALPQPEHVSMEPDLFIDALRVRRDVIDPVDCHGRSSRQKDRFRCGKVFAVTILLTSADSIL